MRLVIVDGLDGVGKDTHGKLIAEYYKDSGEQVIVRSHPTGDNYFGRIAKNALLHPGKVNKIKASLFYMLDVLRSIRKYYRANKKGTLIMVRYLMGTAYLPKRLVRLGYTFFEHFVPTSSYMFFLDAPTEEILRRIQQRKEHEIFETYDALEKVRRKAMLLLKNWYIIDTSGSVDDTFAAICLILQDLDKKEGP
jgi:dTMP kinase